MVIVIWNADVDTYTVFLDNGMIREMDSNANMPNGLNLYIGNINGEYGFTKMHIEGTLVPVSSLPASTQKAIERHNNE